MTFRIYRIGHVPAADIRRLLQDKPKAIGLTVRGMPAGAPAMDDPERVPYQTLRIQPDGTTITLARH